MSYLTITIQNERHPPVPKTTVIATAATTTPSNVLTGYSAETSPTTRYKQWTFWRPPGRLWLCDSNVSGFMTNFLTNSTLWLYACAFAAICHGIPIIGICLVYYLVWAVNVWLGQPKLYESMLLAIRYG